MASPLNTMLEVIAVETRRIQDRSNEDMMDINDYRKLEILATTYAKIRSEIRTTKKQSVLENKNTDELLELVQEAMRVLKKDK